MTTRRYRHRHPSISVYLAVLIMMFGPLLVDTATSSLRNATVVSTFLSRFHSAFTAFAQSPLPTDVQMHVDFGFGGRFRPGYWTPIRITLLTQNTVGDVTLSAHTLQGSPIPGLAQSTRQQHTVTLRPGAPVTVDMILPLTDAFHPLRIDLINDTGRTLATETLDLQRRTIDGDFLIALDDTGRRWSWLETHLGVGVSARGQRLGFEVVYVESPQHVPASWLAYHGVTAVAISDSFPLERLVQAQVAALTEWVAAGGRLIWTGGASMGATSGLLAQRLAPVAFARRTTTVGEMALTPRYAPLPTDVRLILWEGSIVHPSAHLLAGTLAAPLVSRRPAGRGTVFYTAFDPSVPAALDWAGSGTLARDMMIGAAPLRSGLADVETAIWQALDGQPVPYPRPTVALFGLCVYALLLGAVWLYPPRGVSPAVQAGLTTAFVVVFAIVPLVVVQPAISRARHMALTVTASFVNDDGTGESWHYRTLRSASATSWPLTGRHYRWGPKVTDQLATSAPPPDMTLFADATGDVTLHMAPQQVGRLRAVTPATLPLVTALELQGQQYRLTVTNDAATNIDHLFYVTAGNVVSLGHLAAGASVTQSMSSTARSAQSLSADWLSQTLVSQLKAAQVQPDPAVTETMAALVRYRHRQGSAGTAADDGFVIGLFAADDDAGVQFPTVGGQYHMFVADVVLRATAERM